MKSIKFYFLLTATFVIYAMTGQSQTISDALRYSTMEFGATGRAMGTGGSFGALGADFSLIGANPAGLASFRKSEFTFTGGLEGVSTQSALNGTSPIDEMRTKFNLASVGLVFHGRPRSSGWRTANFGIGVNRIGSFHQEFFFEGATLGSITDRWLELVDGYFPDELASLDPFEANLAYEASAVYQDGSTSGSSTYFTDYEGSSVPLQKSQTVTSKGGITEFAISLAGNYEDKLYIGAALGVPFVFFNEVKNYRESDEGDEIPAFDDLEFNEYLTTAGTGINFKLGLIYRVNQAFRLGLAAHTPTRFSLQDDFSTDLDYKFTDPNVAPYGLITSPEGLFEYNLITPWRLSGSAGVIIGQNGFLSGEVEWVDYSSASFDFDEGSQDDKAYARELNQSINRNYTSAVNVRLGGELAYKIFRFRGGLGLLGSPYEVEGDLQTTYHAGLGIRENKFFLDLGYRLRNYTETYFPYLLEGGQIQTVENDVRNGTFTLTVGFKL